MQNDINGKNLACNLHFADFWISSRICCCKLQFFIFASCILHFFANRCGAYLKFAKYKFCILRLQRRFLLGSFYYGAKFKLRPMARNLQKLDFAFCILQLFAVLSTCQLARSKNKILHFAFFCKFAISQKLSANIDFLQFARSFCIFSQFCKKVMISKYPPLVCTFLRHTFYVGREICISKVGLRLFLKLNLSHRHRSRDSDSQPFPTRVIVFADLNKHALVT